MLRYVLIAALGLITLPPSPAVADSILNDLAPSVFGPRTQGPKPEDTLIAPFAQNSQGTRKLDAQAEAAVAARDSNVPLDTAHRPDTTVATWAEGKTITALTYNPTDTAELEARAADLKSAFASSGLDELNTTLGRMGIPDGLVANHQKIAAFSSVASTVAYSGNFNGVYRWVIDVPVSLSVMPEGLKNYRTVDDNGVKTTPLNIRVQISRVMGTLDHSDGMTIERFTVLAPSS